MSHHSYSLHLKLKYIIIFYAPVGYPVCIIRLWILTRCKISIIHINGGVKVNSKIIVHGINVLRLTSQSFVIVRYISQNTDCE